MNAGGAGFGDDELGNGDSGRSVISLIRELQAGTLKGMNLAPADRRRCIEHLSGEGYTVPEIAEILKVTDRTIQRDRAVIKQENALQPRPELLAEMAGYLMRQAESTVGRLRRIARDRETPPQVRVEAERGSFITIRECVGMMQSLGYLPSAPTAVVGHLQHRWAGEDGEGRVLGFADLRAEAQQLQAIVSGSGAADPDVLRQIREIQDEVDRLELGCKLRAVAELVAAPSSVVDEVVDSSAAGVPAP